MKSLQQMALLMLVGTASASASAQELNQADTAWVLTATALVLFMTIPGLSLFYGGLVRVKNVLSILMQCFALTCLMSLLWFAVGYTIAFGSDGVEQGAFIGDFGTSCCWNGRLSFCISTALSPVLSGHWFWRHHAGC